MNGIAVQFLEMYFGEIAGRTNGIGLAHLANSAQIVSLNVEVTECPI